MRLPVLARTTHKWLGLLVGLQMVIWTLSGAYMVAVHIDIIHGDHLIRTPAEQAIPLSGVIEPRALQQRFPDLRTLRLQRWMERPVYVVQTPSASSLIDAVSGEVLSPVNEQTARQVARRWFNGEAPIVKAELLTELPQEIQTRKPPLWRIEFQGWNKPTFYISPQTGELVSRRHELWRVFDFVWSLHIMDYVERENPNSPLLRVATVSALLMTLSGAWLLLYSFRRRRRQNKAPGPTTGAPVGTAASPMPPLMLFRKLHKWVGLVLGAQVVLWTVSGAAMAILDHHAVAGEHVTRPVEPPPLTSTPIALGSLSQADGGGAQSVTLRPLLDRYVYEVRTEEGVRLFDSATGGGVVIDEALARAVAQRQYAGQGPVAGVTRLPQPNLETRDREGPLWRVEFKDAEGTAFYVAAETGELLEKRTNTYRAWDVFWMIHIMDYGDRQSFNHPLIWTLAAAGVWMSITGVVLVFLAFRRADFAFFGRLRLPAGGDGRQKRA